MLVMKVKFGYMIIKEIKLKFINKIFIIIL
jgi:hypothetical protein